MEEHNDIEDNPPRRVSTKGVVTDETIRMGGISGTKTRGKYIYRVPPNEIIHRRKMELD